MPELPVTIGDVRHAATVIHGHVRRTPVLSCASLGAGVWLKAELLQRTGAFKVRGAFSRISELTAEERARGVVTCSAGNHAAAVALAGRELGTDALMMMPSSASVAKVEATRAYGGTADLESADAAEAFARMHAESEASGRVIVHPFDDRAVMAGQGTLGLELCEQVDEVTQVVVPVGGGGLISGVATAVKALAPDARVIGVEPAGISTLGASLAAGAPVPRPAGTTIADALAPPSIGPGPLAVLTELLDEAVTVSEEQLAEAFRFVYARAKLAVEPAAAAPVAALLSGVVEPVPGTVLVLSGGNVAAELAASLLAGESFKPRARRARRAAPRPSRSRQCATRASPSSWRAHDQCIHQRGGACHRLVERRAGQAQTAISAVNTSPAPLQNCATCGRARATRRRRRGRRRAASAGPRVRAPGP